MMKGTDLIEQYHALDAMMGQMLEAAKANDWDAVFEIELLYVTQFETLKALESKSKGLLLSYRQQAQKTAIIEHILTVEQAVKAIVAPTMAALSKQIKGAQTQTKLNNSYIRQSYAN